jgi:beta-lactam-binding protein with PASTA domain
VTVPNFVGYSISDCNNIAAYYGVNISVTGAASSSSTAIAQSVPEGSEVEPGSVITITFSSAGIAD